MKDARLGEARAVTLEGLERDIERWLADARLLLGRAREATVAVPTDLLFHLADALMPPERMAVCAAREAGGVRTLGAAWDVTGRARSCHVSADPAKLVRALMALEASGSELALWAHSHPGTGAGATWPSAIDRAQYESLSRDYGDALLAAIVTADGHVRLWGDAVESGRVRVEVDGRGAEPLKGERHVYRLLR